MHCSCGTGETRREEVDLPDRRVSEETFERRTAFLGTLEGFVTRAAEAREMREVTVAMKNSGDARRTQKRIMAAIQSVI